MVRCSRGILLKHSTRSTFVTGDGRAELACAQLYIPVRAESETPQPGAPSPPFLRKI